MKLKVAVLAMAAIVILVVAVMAAGVSPWAAAAKLIQGSLGTKAAFAGTLRELTPLLLAGIAVFIALKAGLFNIGVEGQITVGALAAAYVGLSVQGVAGMILAVVAGTAVGALWALPVGLIKAYRGGHEVITTIMFNNVAGFLTTALVSGPLKDPAQEGTTTAKLSSSTLLPMLIDSPPLRISAGLLVGLLLLIASAFWFKRSVAGFELSLVGANIRAAELAGVNTRKTLVAAMVASGAVGGLAGAIQVLAYQERFFAGLSSGYGFDALGVALLAGGSAIALLPSSFLFAALAQGGNSIQFIGVPKGITYVILGFLILVFAAVKYRKSEGHD